MKHLVSDIITEFDQIVQYQIGYLEEKVMPLPEEDLIWRPSQYKWNILEVVEHLNRFGVFYLPKFQSIIQYPKSVVKSDYYKSGFFGEFAVKQIRPVNGVIKNKAKSLSKNNPFLRQLDKRVIHEHKEQQLKFMSLSREAANINLSKNGIPTMISSFVKLNLGDSLRVMLYHAERHYIQIDNLVHKRMDA